MKTMICLILDRSGSMNGREKDVIGGVNSFIDDQKKLPDPASVAFVRFDTNAIERFRAMGPLADVKPLTADDYQPRGGTPLLDAVGQSIAQLEDDWKAEKPDRCIVVIVTDGEENSSHEYTKDKIKALVKSRQDSGLWSFIYLGANVDAFAEAGRMGFAAANTAGYVNTAAGTASMYGAASAGVKQMRATGATVAHNLGRNIGEKEAPDATAGSAAVTPTSGAWIPPTSTGTAAAPATGIWTPPA